MASNPIKFKIEKKLKTKVSDLGRAGVIETPHGVINTPAFIVVGTKANVKAVTPDALISTGTEAVLANTYHLYLTPGHKVVEKAGGLHNFMNWSGPIFTDSGGFQVFSLGAAYGKSVSKIASDKDGGEVEHLIKIDSPAQITEEGVSFKSHIDGKKHFLSPEKSIEIQHSLGADIILAFDECTSPHAPKDYQNEALERTHRWAKQSLDYHKKSEKSGVQGLFAVVQGGRHEDLRKKSAKVLSGMPFDGYCIGGSFIKEDIDVAISWVNEILPEDKPRHLLGIGEPEDIFCAVERGCDTFDCVLPTRMARHGSAYTRYGKINIMNARFVENFTPIDSACGCYTCKNFTLAYLSHLFRAKETLAGTLLSIHNIYFIVNLVKTMREAILNDSWQDLKDSFLKDYKTKRNQKNIK